MILNLSPRRKRDSVARYLTGSHSANGELLVAASARLRRDPMELEPVAAAGPFTSKNNSCTVGWSENLEGLTVTEARAVALEVLDQLIQGLHPEKFISATQLHLPRHGEDLHPAFTHWLTYRSAPTDGRSPRQNKKGRGHRDRSLDGPGEDA